MENNKSELLNNISRLLGAFGFFWSLLIPFLGWPFFIISIIMSIKRKNEFDAIANILFSLFGLILSIIILIFLNIN